MILGSPPAGEAAKQGELVDRTRFEGGEVDYELGGLPDHWEPEEVEAGDAFFFTPQYGATVATRSICNRYTDSPLSRLARDLLGGVTERKILREETLPFAGREAFDLVADGKIDGVPVRVWVRVLKKNRCIFDFTLVAPPGTFEAAQADFQGFLNGFKTRD